VLVGQDSSLGDPLMTTEGDWVGVGTVRLDNRAELERRAEPCGQELTDLALVVRAIAGHGVKCIPEFLGDFAFVVWNTVTRVAVAATDAFSVRKLYYTHRAGLFVFASRGDVLGLGGHYDVQHLAELVAGCRPSPDLSVYAGVSRLPAATMALVKGGHLTLQQYWSFDSFEPERRWLKSEREATEVCQGLFTDSVRLRLNGKGDVWAQLSGGLDSSSIVSVAQSLAAKGTVAGGLAGTVTFVDRQGTGTDERYYSDTVVKHWGVRNELIVDPPLWHDDQYAPPLTDQPRLDFVFYPRDCRLCEIVQGAGGRVLLTGVGGDELFTGVMFFFADWIAQGRLLAATREMARRAAIGRVSFWELAYRNAILPLLPRPIRLHLVDEDERVPPWLSRAMVRRYGLQARAFGPLSHAGPLGHKYHHAIVTYLVDLARSMEFDVIGDTLELRHPFLHRPLVEFALRLPPDLCARPYARKWLLRQAMRGIVPEVVRTRVGKGRQAELYAWSLATQGPLLAPLLRNPILADLGVVDAAQLAAAFNSAPSRHSIRYGAVQSTLIVEAWLQMRSGRWPRRGITEVQR
jgi:asparagine synthase (glutamine-hydrolysing)